MGPLDSHEDIRYYWHSMRSAIFPTGVAIVDRWQRGGTCCNCLHGGGRWSMGTNVATIMNYIELHIYIFL